MDRFALTFVIVLGLAACGGEDPRRSPAKPAVSTAKPAAQSRGAEAPVPCDRRVDDGHRALTLKLPPGWCWFGATSFAGDNAFATFPVRRTPRPNGCRPGAVDAVPVDGALLYVFEYGFSDEGPDEPRTYDAFARGKPSGRAALRTPVRESPCFGRSRAVLWIEHGRRFRADLYLGSEASPRTRRQQKLLFDRIDFRRQPGLVGATPPRRNWSSYPRPSLARGKTTAVWAGDELFLWGGSPRPTNSAQFDPRIAAWRLESTSTLAPRESPAAVWTGREVILWGGEAAADGAAFEPETSRWRRIARAPLSARVPVATVWTGREMLVWGDTDRNRRARGGAAYDPARDRWRRLPPAPFALTLATATWTGDEMVVLGSRLDNRNGSRTRFAQAMAYDPDTERWRTLPSPRLSPQASSVIWTGRELLAWDYLLEAATLDPGAGRWRPLPDLPLDFSECHPSSARLGDRIFAWYCGTAALYDRATRSWRRAATPRRTPRGLPVTGDGTVVFAGGGERLATYRPG